MEQELRIAAEIQQALLPEPSRKGAFFDAVGQSVACRSIGGDFFDYVDLPSGAFGFAVGDVAGKGAPAALLTAVIQGVFSSQAQSGRVALRDAVAGEPGAAPARDRVAVLHGVLRRLAPDGSLTYCNAGHNPPMVFTANGVDAARKRRPHPRALRARDVRGRTITLAAGDLLVAFSDGVTEAMSASGEEYGEERLLECVAAPPRKSAAELLDAIFASVRVFWAGAVQSDDVTALVVRYDGHDRPMRDRRSSPPRCGSSSPFSSGTSGSTRACASAPRSTCISTFGLPARARSARRACAVDG